MHTQRIALKQKSRSNEFLADRTAACSTTGYHSNSWTSCFLWHSVHFKNSGGFYRLITRL